MSWRLPKLQEKTPKTLLPSLTSRILQQTRNTMSPPFIRGVLHDSEEYLWKKLDGTLVLSARSSHLVAMAGSEVLGYRMEENASAFKTLLGHGYHQGRKLRVASGIAPGATFEQEDDEDMDQEDDGDASEWKNADDDGKDSFETTKRTSKLPLSRTPHLCLDPS